MNRRSHIRKLVIEYFIPRLVTDIVSFYLVLLLVAAIASRLALDWAFILGAIANYLLLVFAFIYNDIEDRDDDANSVFVPQTGRENLRMLVGMENHQQKIAHQKRFSNPFSFGYLSLNQGYAILAVLAVTTILLSLAAGGAFTAAVASITLAVALLYSWQKVRLKSVAVLDLLSHGYLLAGAFVLYFLTYPNAERDVIAFVLFALVYLNSIAGDLRNESRDFAEDRQSEISNTASLLGRKRTLLLSQVLYYISLLGVIVVAAVLLLN